MNEEGLYATVANNSRGCSMIFEGLPNAHQRQGHFHKDSGVCACLDESGLCLSMLIYLLSISCFYFSLDFISPACSCFYFSVLLPLFFQSLVRLASLGSLFFRFGHVSPCSAWPVLRGGLAALCLVSQLSVWSRGALLRRLGHRRCECDSSYSRGGLPLPCPRPLPLHVRGIEERFISQSLTLLLVGRTGW